MREILTSGSVRGIDATSPGNERLSEEAINVYSTERAELDEFLEVLPVLPVTLDIAKAGGLLRRAYFKSHGVGLADALLAATAESHDLELQTLNTRHYPMFAGLKPPYTKSPS